MQFLFLLDLYNIIDKIKLETVFKKKHSYCGLLVCKTGPYILIIIINTKLLHDLISLKHKLFYLHTCPVNIICHFNCPN